MPKNYYITTPIYYPSAKPHMGHAYSSIIADFFARFKRMDGYEVHFLTGTDEHGLKIQRAAEKKKIDPLKFCDEISETFRNLSKILNLSNTDFIRTTEERHKKTVQYLWSELEKNGDIYLSKYSGWYSISDEAFYNDDEIKDIDGKKFAIISNSPVEWIEEESYFFRLSKWQDDLLKYLSKITIQYDKVLAAAVMVHFSKLENVFSLVSDRLKIKGEFIFSIFEGTQKDIELNSSFFYEHSSDYIASLANQHKLKIVYKQQGVHEYHKEIPVSGLIYVLQKSK